MLLIRKCGIKIMSLLTVNCCLTDKNVPSEAKSYFYNIASHFDSYCTVSASFFSSAWNNDYLLQINAVLLPVTMGNQMMVKRILLILI